MRNPLSIEAFADWASKQPADKAYSYSNCGGHCAFGQYLEALGFPLSFVGISDWLDTSGVDHPLPDWVDEMVKGSSRHMLAEHTFGALAQRLRSAS